MNLKIILKGFITGLGKILPGVSGSLLAISLGIYENIIDAVTNFFNKPKENAKLLFNFSLGIIIAIIFFSKLILFLLNNYYAEVMYLFLGLIIGTIIPFIKKIKLNIKYLFILFITLMSSLSLNFINQIANNTITNYFYTIILGIIDAFTSIIPGLSGTAIFMLLGSYEYILTILSNPFSLRFIIYGIGMILGIIIVCYLMNYLFKHYYNLTNILILGLMFGSIILLFLKIITLFNGYMLLLLILGFILGIKFS